MNVKILSAIFRRNFISYFSSPTGYVFICVFVLLSSFYAFWPDEFFNANLANLGQLNKYFPFIMLVFIPAITMGVWAEERRQGTDELLLTIPANDSDVVLGKYLAAVAIFFVSLIFSFVSNFLVLSQLGEPDFLLLLANYFGYLMVGMAMLSIGMVASFLTSNITVGYVLGAMFNAPLAFLEFSVSIIPRSDRALQVKEFGIANRLDDFSRGLVSISSVMFFLMIVVVMLFLSMVLIGRRHWLGGRDGRSMLGHYLLRAAALVTIGFCITMFFDRYDFLRLDSTIEGLNTVSPKTVTLLEQLHVKELKKLAKEREKLDERKIELEGKEDSKKELKKIEKQLKQLDRKEHKLKQPIRIEAFISPNVPEAYVQTRLDLIAKLNEMDQLAGDKVEVTIFDTEPYSEIAQKAEDQYGIEMRFIPSVLRGSSSEKHIFLGAAITSGLEKVVVPFFDLGIPVEYELVRSIVTVSGAERKKLAVLTNDANLFGGIHRFATVPKQAIITELEKQYDVIEVSPFDQIVDPDDPEKEQYDVLLVVQPSALGPAELDKVLAAIKSGLPTAIFEDPMPIWWGDVVRGTDQPRAPQQSFMMRGPPTPRPKGDINKLFNLLGIKMEQVKKQIPLSIQGETQEQSEKAKELLESEVPEETFKRLDKNSDGKLSLREFTQVNVGLVIGHRAETQKVIDSLKDQDREIEIKVFYDLDRNTREAAKDWFVSKKEYMETSVVWQAYLPYPRLQQEQNIGNQFVFASDESPDGSFAFDSNEKISSGLKEVLFPFPGAIVSRKDPKLEFIPLVRTGTQTGKIRIDDISENIRDVYDLRSVERPTKDKHYTLAARIRSKVEKKDESNAEDKEKNDADKGAKKKPKHTPGQIDVVFVSDIDVLHTNLLQLRANPHPDYKFRFQNVVFVLNIIDALSKDDRFIEIRKREQQHRKLTKVENQLKEARKKKEIEVEKYIEEFQVQKKEAEKKMLKYNQDIEDEIKKLITKQGIDTADVKQAQEKLVQRNLERRAANIKDRNDAEKRKRKRDKEIQLIEKDHQFKVRQIQQSHKLWAVFIPPIPPLLLAFIVFLVRRAREKEGVSKQRLR